jgi:uncharacterized protein (DUF1015 family)
MAVILPFRGLRYSTQQALDLSLVTAPPYDCISPDQQQTLYDAHPHNIVRLILGLESPADTPADNRYTRAAKCLREWLSAGVLTREKRPALYLYEQEFTVAGGTLVRRGFVSRVALEEFGKGSIFPHEQTFSGPKEDRLKLLKATHVNLTQVFALYPDEKNEVMSVFDRLPLASPDLQVVDSGGVINRLWIVTDESAASEVAALMHRRPLFIADGHHRYTTALNYRKYLIDKGETISDHHPANFTSIMCVSMSDPGLVILPTHRILENLPPLAAERMREILKDHFVWHKFTGAEATSGRLEAHLAKCRGVCFGVYLRDDQAAYTASLKDPALMDRLAPDRSPAWRQLDVAVLHRLILERLLPDALGGLKDLSIRYVHLGSEAFDAVHESTASAAFLLRPTRIDQVQAIAGSGELMPHKSTYFYPKLLSGLTMNPLD